MVYEVQVKAGRSWGARPSRAALTMSAAALSAHQSSGYKTVRVRPEGSRDKWYTYVR